MHVEVEHLSRTLKSWIDAVRAAGVAYHEGHHEGESAAPNAPRLRDVVLPTSPLGDATIRPVLGMWSR